MVGLANPPLPALSCFWRGTARDRLRFLGPREKCQTGPGSWSCSFPYASLFPSWSHCRLPLILECVAAARWCANAVQHIRISPTARSLELSIFTDIYADLRYFETSMFLIARCAKFFWCFASLSYECVLGKVHPLARYLPTTMVETERTHGQWAPASAKNTLQGVRDITTIVWHLRKQPRQEKGGWLLPLRSGIITLFW